METQTGKHCWSNLSTMQRSFIKAFTQGEAAFEAGLSAGYGKSWSESRAQNLLNQQKIQQALTWYKTVYTLPQQQTPVEKTELTAVLSAKELQKATEIAENSKMFRLAEMAETPKMPEETEKVAELEYAETVPLSKAEKSDSFKKFVQKMKQITQATNVCLESAIFQDVVDMESEITPKPDLPVLLVKNPIKKGAKKQAKVAKCSLLNEEALVESVQLPFSDVESAEHNTQTHTQLHNQIVTECMLSAENVTLTERSDATGTNSIAKAVKVLPSVTALLMDARKASDVWHDVYTIMCQSRDGGDSKTALKCLEIECKLLGILKDRKNEFEAYLNSEGKNTTEVKEEQKNGNNSPNPVVAHFLSQLQTMGKAEEIIAENKQ